ncbi:DsbA family protein [Leucobacter sp. wl10]|uniref:mycothiol-dependent nitroreductase Rv2466c family protein n=1 Tax=Leucobacter sp. wl10 TaxID=2304677 RepID=UPI000E5A1EDC|nr:DsbA family protein [Leucobacter sp. wl10]RGE18082.1 disulfide bond formation protein DsbA [Leucobacter sp. wl10]
MSNAASPSVEFYFDPICPWCWMTSRWAAEVAETRGFEIDWRPISLQIVNEGEDPGSLAEVMRQGHRMGQVALAVGAEAGSAAVGALYTEMGTRIHPGARTDYDEIILESLAAVDGVSTGLLEAAGRPDDAQLRENTRHALEIAGPDVGVPIISIDGVAFFGPVVTPAPTGEAALQLWDGIYAAASVPGFYELKRGRTEGPKF